MHKDKLSGGALKYQLGMGYKECSSTQELNEWLREERLSKCGYLNTHWNKMGNTSGNQLRIPMPENNDNTFVFVGEKISKEIIRSGV